VTVIRSWAFAAAVLACGLVVAVPDLLAPEVTAGDVAAAVLVVLVAAGFAALLSPLAFPRSVAAAEAQARSAADGRPVVYWRPGCRFCLALRFRLGRDAGRAHWVDIWRDPAGAAAVREVTGGDETVPTVVAGDRSLVNPDPDQVRALLP
jgi:mycoredoxin